MPAFAGLPSEAPGVKTIVTLPGTITSHVMPVWRGPATPTVVLVRVSALAGRPLTRTLAGAM